MRTTPTRTRLARLLVPVAAVALAGAAVGGGPATVAASGPDALPVRDVVIGLLPPVTPGGCGSTWKKPDLWDELFPACPNGTTAA